MDEELTKEQRRDLRPYHPELSAVAEHSIYQRHGIEF
jgi:hypothetical protein